MRFSTPIVITDCLSILIGFLCVVGNSIVLYKVKHRKDPQQKLALSFINEQTIIYIICSFGILFEGISDLYLPGLKDQNPQDQGDKSVN
jgi:hypothetical protein